MEIIIQNIKNLIINLTKSVSALSFQHLFIKRKLIKIKFCSIPILEKDSEKILIICKNFMKKSFFTKYKLIVRPHPTQKNLTFLKKINNLNIKNSVIDNNKNFYETLNESKYFIGGMSSTCLEAIIFNIPTIIFKSNDYLRSSCIPEIIKKKYYLY